VVGVVDFALTDDHAELARISIHPDHQDSGLGTAALTSLLERADEQDVPVQLEVFDTNPARRLYERLGFVEVAVTGTRCA
jgi:ribosomal protein S18 acetylase RimI-like enzyme